LFGLVAIQVGTASHTILAPAGWFIVVWAGVDLLMNSGRILLDISGREAGFEYCTIAQAGRLVHRPRVFLAIDTLLTFGIICAMLWSGWITRLTLLESYFWYAATTLNLISLSLVSLYHEIQD
jgi:cation transport ATPase